MMRPQRNQTSDELERQWALPQRRPFYCLSVGAIFLYLALGNSIAIAQDPAEVLKLWPGTPPGDEGLEFPPEADTTGEDGRLVAGQRVIRLGNVSSPELAVYPADPEIATGAAVVICPGGGHYILAYDLEGTEVASWLNSIGVTAIVLKYRVPARDRSQRWVAAVQDAQRTLSLVRSRADEWAIDPDRIGILGFSAGGETAGLTAIFENERQYEAIDQSDQHSCRPDFAVLIYPAGFYDPETDQLASHIELSESTPPMFFVHAVDDRVPAENSVELFLQLKRVGVASELHIFDRGGHGYGLRRTDEPVTTWPTHCHAWLQSSGWLEAPTR